METSACALLISEIVQDKHAEDVVIFEVTELTSIADFFVICSADSVPQIRAIANAVNHELAERGKKALGIEGRDAGVWMLLDYGDIIVHIFHKKSRDFYGLDRLWGDAPRLTLPGSKAEAPQTSDEVLESPTLEIVSDEDEKTP